MPRHINLKLDALFVEGPDDRAVVNAFVKKSLGVDLVEGHTGLVKTKSDGGGDSWALAEFDKYRQERLEARVGVIVDRDSTDNNKWPKIRERLRVLGETVETPATAGAIVGGRCGIWMWPDNVSLGDLEHFVAGIVPSSPVLAYAAEVCGAVYGATPAPPAAMVTSFATSR